MTTIKLDIELKNKIKNKKYDKRELELLFDVVKSLEKSPKGKILRIISRNKKTFKIMEKRATRSYRPYFIFVIQDDTIVVLDIIKKKFQNIYIDFIDNTIEDIFNRND